MLTISQVTRAVFAAGHRAPGVGLRTAVGQALCKRRWFIRVGKGRYALRKKPRAGTFKTLVAMLAEALEVRPSLTVAEATQAVIASGGYRTKSTSLRLAVNKALCKTPRFKRVAAGRYALRGAAQRGGRKTLIQVLVEVFDGKPSLTLAEARQAAIHAGYRVRKLDEQSGLRTQVTRVLRKRRKWFVRLGRGKYALRA